MIVLIDILYIAILQRNRQTSASSEPAVAAAVSVVVAALDLKIWIDGESVRLQNSRNNNTIFTIQKYLA